MLLFLDLSCISKVYYQAFTFKNFFFSVLGDNRLQGMETGAALTRAMVRVMNSSKTGKKIHVINMSYGETAHHNNSGLVNNKSLYYT